MCLRTALILTPCPKERLVRTCLENRLAVYSPHTAYDCLDGGVADWLISPFVADPADVSVIHSSSELAHSGGFSHKVSARHVPPLDGGDQPALAELLAMSGVNIHFSDAIDGSVEVLCSNANMGKVIKALKGLVGLEEQITVVSLERHPAEGRGMGRIARLKSPITLEEVVARVKTLTGLKKLRLTRAVGKGMGKEE